MTCYSFVYFIRQGKRGPIKVGYVLNPFQRLDQLQGANPFKLELIGCIRGTLETEDSIKRALVDHRIRGEWFTANKHVNSFIRARLAAEGVSNEVIEATIEECKIFFPNERPPEPSPRDDDSVKRALETVRTLHQLARKHAADERARDAEEARRYAVSKTINE